MASTAPTTELVSMLTYRRPAFSKTEKQFIRDWIVPLGIKRDGFGNCHKIIGDDPKIVWSCHTDSVHSKGGRQKVIVENGMVKLAPNSKSDCLGGDDAAGVWIMRQMILAGIEGHYIFHRAEEIGGLGSRHIAEREPHLLEGREMAIAFDRKGTRSVITHQCGRCCSDEFANALSILLGDGFYPDDSGLFTDTANYTDLIGECTNLSTGYFAAHSEKEMQDLEHMQDLFERIKRLDVSALPVARQPGEFDLLEQQVRSLYRLDKTYDDGDLGETDPDVLTYQEQVRAEDILDACRENPDAAAELLLEFGFCADDVYERAYELTGNVPLRALG